MLNCGLEKVTDGVMVRVCASSSIRVEGIKGEKASGRGQRERKKRVCAQRARNGGVSYKLCLIFPILDINRRKDNSVYIGSDLKQD